jgi:hypothetical protein
MSKDSHENNASRFDKLAQQKRPTLISEFWYFLKYNKKWWLLPILIVLLLLAMFVVLGGSAAAPFIYTLF